jgi:hypothetical protein
VQFSRIFYRTAAICSFASAVTTLALIFMPEGFDAVADLDARMARVNDPLYRVYAWIYLAHPFLVMTAALGVAMRLRREIAGLVIPGLLGFLLWGATEAGQQALTLLAFNPWRLAYLAGDPAVRATMELRTAIYDGIWNAMFFLLLVCFLIGNVLYAAALARGRGLTRVVSVFYAGAALLTSLELITELGGPSVQGPLGFWLYPLIQPLARTLIGVWLWRHDEEDGPPLLEVTAARARSGDRVSR